MPCNLDLLLNDNVNVKRIRPYSAKVTPPDGFVCHSGQRRFERIFYVSEGVFNIRFGQGSLTVKKGGIIYLPSGVHYVSNWDEGQQGEYFALNFELYDDSGRSISLGDSIERMTDDLNDKIYNDFTEIYSSYISSPTGGNFKAYSLFWQLLCDLDNIIKKVALKSRYKSIYKAVMYLEQNFASDITSPELAAMCGLSEGAFRRLFKQYKNISPIKYRNELKIKKAVELLESGDFNVTEAAEAVGCQDICYFSKLFKSVTGKNPADFKPF